MGKKIAVTGAGGYIGRHVVKALCDRGATVIAVDLHTEGLDPRSEKLSVDIFRDSTDIFRELGFPDACLHMAWKDGFQHNAPAHMEMLSQHYRFFENLFSGGLKQLAVMGTMHEIGYYEGEVTEDTPCNPISMYGIAKDALRRSTICLAKEKNVCLQWLRAYYICGDDERNHSIFAKLTAAEKAGQKTFPFTSGKNKYDFIDIEELAQQIAASVMQTEINGIINCCTGVPVSLAEKVEGFLQEKNFAIKLDYGAFPDRPYDSPGIWGNNIKIRQIMENKDGIEEI